MIAACPAVLGESADIKMMPATPSRRSSEAFFLFFFLFYSFLSCFVPLLRFNLSNPPQSSMRWLAWRMQ